MPKTFKALTLWQPWASYMAEGLKCYETRSWHPGNRLHVGEIVMIHAAKRWDRNLQSTHQYLRSCHPELAGVEITDFGVIVGAFKFLGAHPTDALRHKLLELELAMGDFSQGRYGWHFELIKRAVPPVPATGQQGVWRWSNESESE